MTTITAVVPAYNAEKYLEQSLMSVLKQTRPCDEIVVVDDGSLDGTADVARSFPEVRYIYQDNRGDADARNRAISETSSDFIAFLDADDLWKPEKLHLQLQMFESRPSLGMVYTGVEVVNEELQRLEILRPATNEVAFRNTLIVEKPYMTGVGSSGLVRTSIARAIGFDPRLGASADWAFACYVALSHEVDAVQAPLILYRQHSDSQVHLNLRAVEHDMRLVWSEIFDHPDMDPKLRFLRRRALANLSLSLAASYFKRGDRRSFLRYLARAFLLRPDRVTAALWRRYLVPPS